MLAFFVFLGGWAGFGKPTPCREKKKEEEVVRKIDRIQSILSLSVSLSFPLLKDERLRAAAGSVLLAIGCSCHALIQVRF